MAKDPRSERGKGWSPVVVHARPASPLESLALFFRPDIETFEEGLEQYLRVITPADKEALRGELARFLAEVSETTAKQRWREVGAIWFPEGSVYAALKGALETLETRERAGSRS